MVNLWSSSLMDILFRLFLAFFLGGLIGLERNMHGRAAGLRTHILVCLGATIIMIMPQLLALHFSAAMGSTWVQSDPGRIVAGIVTGIGFLGAGAIIKIGDIVRGITTAACIWFTAALGVVIGNGHYGLAMIATAMALIVLLLFDRVGHWIGTVHYRKVSVTVQEKFRAAFEERADELFNRFGIRVQDQSHEWQKKGSEFKIVYQIRTKESRNSGSVVQEFSRLEGVAHVAWE